MLQLMTFISMVHYWPSSASRDPTVRVIISAASTHRDDAGGDAAQEVAVVADGDDGAVEALQRLLQHLLAGDVQVVGRLVQHQQRSLREG